MYLVAIQLMVRCKHIQWLTKEATSKVLDGRKYSNNQQVRIAFESILLIWKEHFFLAC